MINKKQYAELSEQTSSFIHIESSFSDLGVPIFVGKTRKREWRVTAYSLFFHIIIIRLGGILVQALPPPSNLRKVGPKDNKGRGNYGVNEVQSVWTSDLLILLLD